MFGTIELRRYGYRYWHRDVPEKTIFPLEIQLGLVGGATPVLAVGRDGISLREYRHRCFEVATAATLTVYDRRGRRLGTPSNHRKSPRERAHRRDHTLTNRPHPEQNRWNRAIKTSAA
jgi:hypothetical protein